MTRILTILILLLVVAAPSRAAGPAAPQELKDLYFGEALYHAFQEQWFEAISRLDTELKQFRGLDEPQLDSLYSHLGQAEFDVGDFELAYRMHRRAGRAITAVIEGNVSEPVRNAAIYRLARLYFQKDQPVNAQQTLERINGVVPPALSDDLPFLRAEVLLANGRFKDATAILEKLQGAKSLTGFAPYNLGIALIRAGDEEEGREWLDRAGQVEVDSPLTAAIRDKANLVLGEKLLDEKQYEPAKLIFDRVRLKGPFSNRALLGSGWADASRDRFDLALVPWNLLADGQITDPAVQEAMLALPFAYGKLNLHSNAALLYGWALETYSAEIDKLGASIKSIREGKFLAALAREELRQDANWAVRLRKLPETPETYYLLDLMASNDFQESLKNYLDLNDLLQRLESWDQDLKAYEEIIALRRAYYEPLLPQIDQQFRKLDSQMRLRLEQRDRIEKRLQSMLVAPRPDYLATAAERIAGEQLNQLERAVAARGSADPEVVARIRRLRGLMTWSLQTEYDQRLTEAHTHLRDLNQAIDLLNKQYTSFVRTRQAATQSYEGYADTIRRQRMRIDQSRSRVQELMARQGHLLETMAVGELTRRRERLDELQVKARFALADSYDRVARAKEQNEPKEQKEASP